jgi:beta-lactam-binding protein with PASTA domain
VGLHFGLRGGWAGGAAELATVPELVGMTPDQARPLVENAKLSLQVIGSTVDPFIAKGAVAKQVPLAGQQVPTGSNVVVTISEGSGAPAAPGSPGPSPPSGGTVVLPSLVKLTLAEAVNRLGQLGLELGPTSTRPQPGVEAGRIVATDPPPGAAVKPGSQVKLVLSQSAGPPSKAVRRRAPSAGGSATVPKVIGIRLQHATGRLAAQGLSVGHISYASDEDHMEGYILRQSPGPGTPLPRGSTVVVVVNRTP